MALKIPISFKESEKDLFDFLNKQRSPSIYIKELLQREKDKETKKSTSEQKNEFELDF